MRCLRRGAVLQTCVGWPVLAGLCWLALVDEIVLARLCWQRLNGDVASMV